MSAPKKGLNEDLGLKMDFVAQLKKLHREQTQQLQENFLTLEDSCKTEIRSALKEDLSQDLQLFLSKAISQSVKAEFENQFPSLSNKVQEDLTQFSHTLSQTQSSLSVFQKKLSIKWTRPFFFILLTSTLTGSFLGLWLFLLQIPPLAIFLMDQKSREAYTFGMRWVESKEKRIMKLEEEKVPKKNSSN